MDKRNAQPKPCKCVSDPTTVHRFAPKYCAVDSLVNKRKFSPNSSASHDPNKYSPNSFTRQFALVFPFVYGYADAFMGISAMVGI